MNKYQFIKGVERLVDPNEVAMLSFMQMFNRFLPRKVQNYLVESSSKKYPYMGFIVDPYSYFITYELKDLDYARSLLPDGFELVKTKVFQDSEPIYCCIFGCIQAKTSAFIGVRVEFYIIAKDIKTNMTSWIIVDYDTNTISHDKQNGLRDPNATIAHITTDFESILHAQVTNKEGRSLMFSSDLRDGQLTPLDEKLWVEGNLSIAYGKIISQNNPYTFSLKFHPDEFKQALNIPLKSICIEENNWYPGLFHTTPANLACFPTSQHFLSDSPGYASLVRNKEEMLKQIEAIDFDHLSVYSSATFKRMMIISMIGSFILTWTLLLLLIFK